MHKIKLKPQPALGPIPAVLVSCGGPEGEKNILTVAWAGIVNSTPPMLSISVRPSRYSHKLIATTKEFVVNVPLASQVAVVEQCGVVSGAQEDKFARFKLTPRTGSLTYAPLIEQCPVNIECLLEETISLPSHDLFIGHIQAVWAAAEFITNEKCDYRKIPALGFANGAYLDTDFLNLRGFTIKK
jgi:flavin reductase (DIM6/NTAB) family NADH-FMN oxidoreductase RutF